jgi:hypothetical protein
MINPERPDQADLDTGVSPLLGSGPAPVNSPSQSTSEISAIDVGEDARAIPLEGTSVTVVVDHVEGATTPDQLELGPTANAYIERQVALVTDGMTSASEKSLVVQSLRAQLVAQSLRLKRAGLPAKERQARRHRARASGQA